MVKVAVGEAVERFWAKSDSWWHASVIGERKVSKGKRRRSQREVLIHFTNERTARNDAWIAEDSSDLRQPVEYLDAFEHDAGYLDDDQWEVERILDERGTGKSREYLVRWAGWSEEDDSWLPSKQVGPGLVDAWKAAKAANAEAMKIFQSEEERYYAKKHAASTIQLVADDLINKVGRATGEAPRRVLSTVRAVDPWAFQALYERLVDELPAGERAEYVSAPKRIVGANGTTASVADQFHVVSGFTLWEFLSTQQQPERRSGHVALRSTAPATAVGLMTPVTFTRRGPRDRPSKAMLRVTAGFGALADRNDGPPDWRFDDAAKDEDKDSARVHISEALINMNQRNPGTVPEQLLATAEEESAEP